MSRTFFSLRRMRRFISRHPAPLTREDARLVSCPGLLHLSSGIFLSSDDANQFRKRIKPGGCTVSTMGLSEARGLVLFRVYKRECQEHFSPSAGCAGLFRDIQ